MKVKLWYASGRVHILIDMSTGEGRILALSQICDSQHLISKHKDSEKASESVGDLKAAPSIVWTV